MVKADFGRAVAGLMFGASVLATSVSAADLTLDEYTELPGAQKSKFLTSATSKYADELYEVEATRSKAMCVVGSSNDDRLNKLVSVDATIRKYASSKPDYPADKVVRKVFDKLCAPQAVALR